MKQRNLYIILAVIVLGVAAVAYFASKGVGVLNYRHVSGLALMLVAGLAAGGMYASRLLRTPRRWTTWLVGVHFATAVFAIGSLTVLAYAFDRGWISSGPVLASVLAMLPATVCMGASLPVALHVAAMGARGSAAGVAGRVGRLYSRGRRPWTRA